MKVVKILAALSILNSSCASPGAIEKVAALVALATCSGASHSSEYIHMKQLLKVANNSNVVCPETVTHLRYEI